MTGQIAFEALGALPDDLVAETAEGLGFLSGNPSAAMPHRRERSALSRFLGSGWGVALICAVVSLSVLAGVIRAGQQHPSVDPPHGETTPPIDSEDMTHDTESSTEIPSESDSNRETDPSHVHTFGEWETITEATCAAKGERRRICACGETETESVSTLPHIEVIDPAVPPTVTETGLSEGKHCEVCGKVLVKQNKLDATGHTDLAYEVNEDGRTCTVTGIGSCTATDIYFPSSIEGYKVTRIGEAAFMNKPLTGIHFPSSITEIGEAAFYGCTELTAITLPSSITSLGYSVFQNCTGLTSVSLQCRITELPRQSFYGCSVLSKITLPSNLTEIGMSAFSDCVSLEGINLPSALQGIGVAAFQGCTELTDVTLPAGLNILDDMAFEGCSSLTEMVIPDGIIRIGANALSDCHGITTLTVPADVKQAEPSAFERMDSLTDIHFGGSTAEWSAVGYRVDQGVRVHCNDPSLEYALSEDGTYYAVMGLGTYNSPSVVIPDTYNSLPVKEIGASAFSSQDYVTSLHIGRNVERVGDWAFYQSTGLKEVWIQDIEQWLRIDFSGGYHRNPNADKLYVGGELLTHLTVPDTVTEISAFAFAGCASLQSVTVGAQVTRIGASAFSECEGLTSVTFHGAVQEIGSYAFFACTSLEEVTLPDTVTVVDEYAFYRCYALSAIHLGSGVETIGEGAFWDCKSLAEMTLPASLTYIGKYAFRLCSSLQSVVFEVKKGWYAKQYVTDNHISPFGEAALSSPEAAAHYLTAGKEDCFWERKP